MTIGCFSVVASASIVAFFSSVLMGADSNDGERDAPIEIRMDSVIGRAEQYLRASSTNLVGKEVVPKRLIYDKDLDSALAPGRLSVEFVVSGANDIVEVTEEHKTTSVIVATVEFLADTTSLWHEVSYRRQVVKELVGSDRLRHLIAADRLDELVRFALPEDVLDSRDLRGDTPLMNALELARPEIARHLILSGADVTIQGDRGRTALHIAARNGMVAIVELLLQKRVAVNLPDRGGATPLHLAARFGHSDIIRLLLENHSDLNSLDSAERTPIYEAVAGGHVESARLLIEAGADVTLPAKNGRTPIALAREVGGELGAIVDGAD